MWNSKFSVRFSQSVKIAAALVMFASGTHAQQITYSDILAAPDDPELNLQYSRQEIAGGRLEQAAAALERLLLSRPNWDSVRLLYGIVLYRMNDLQGAIRELALLEDRGLPSQQERKRVRYLSLANKQASPIRMSAVLTTGVRVDRNPKRAADLAPFAAGADIDMDYAATGTSQFRVELDLQNGRSDYLFLETRGYINQYFDQDDANYLGSRNTAGAVLHGENFTISPSAFYHASWLDGELFRSQIGGGVDTSWSLSNQVEFVLNGRAAYEDYRATDFSAVGDARNGWRNSVIAGLKFRPTDTQTFSINGGVARKNAKQDAYSYDEHSISLGSLTLLGRGVNLSLHGSYTQNNYDKAVIGDPKREDKRLYGRISIGAPLELLFAETDVTLPEFLADIVAQVGGAYTSQDSSVERYKYNNLSADILFTKRLSF